MPVMGSHSTLKYSRARIFRVIGGRPPRDIVGFPFVLFLYQAKQEKR